MSKTEILKVLVGSHAHGLATEESDKDYRGVYIFATSDLLRVDAPIYKGTHWIESEGTDNTAYEIGRFLQLATKSNASILEVFKSPIIESLIYNKWEVGKELLSLFPYIWSSISVKNAFLGYSHNQRKKMFDPKIEFARRRFKYAVAHLRVMLLGIELLMTEDMTIEVQETYYSNLGIMKPGLVAWVDPYLTWKSFLTEVRKEKISVGVITDITEYLQERLDLAYENYPKHEVNLAPVNDFLLRLRKEFWEPLNG
jgi:predicted nucleotidyltransferase